MKNIMGILGSSLLKNGVSWRGFKGSAIFALGFYTHDAFTPNLKSIIKEAKQSLAEARSLEETCRAHLAEVKETKKLLDDLLRLYMPRMAELEEIKKADGRYSVETCCESQEETEGPFI